MLPLVSLMFGTSVAWTKLYLHALISMALYLIKYGGTTFLLELQGVILNAWSLVFFL